MLPDLDHTEPVDAIPPLRLNIEEGARAIRLSRPQFYKQIRAGKIQIQKDGRRSFVTIEALQSYVRSLSSSAK